MHNGHPDPQRDILHALLSTPGPTGEETAVARIWRAAAAPLADEVSTDVSGNSYALLRGGAVRVLLAGHIDEIGLMVSHIDSDGFVYVQALGGWDAEVLVGQRVRLLGKTGQVVGLIGKKPVHLMKKSDRDTASDIDSLWVDIGVRTRAEAEQRISLGDVAVIDAPVLDLPHGRVASRSIDNRIGAFTVLEALRLLAAERPSATVAAVATTQEETTLAGATTAAYSFDPHIALVVDVTFATDHPQSNQQRDGEVKLGGGPVLARGSANHPLVFARLRDLATEHAVPYSVQVTPRYTGTDADAIYQIRAGIASATVSIPCRYMHSPNEMIARADVSEAARLIALFVRSVQAADEFVPA